MKTIIPLRLAFLCLLMVIAFPGESQDRPSGRFLTGVYDLYPWEGSGGLKFGFHFDRSLRAEFGILKSDIPKRKLVHYEGLANQNISLSSEFNFQFKDMILGPKLSYEYNFILAGVKLSYTHYFDLHGNADPRITPEAGISLVGFFNIFYGYNIPLTPHTFRSIGTHKVSIYINYIPRIFG